MSETSEIWTGKANNYDQVRPAPPSVLLDLLTQLIGMPDPTLVVDLGSGTGLSSAIWIDRAQQVIGIEPNADMRKEATRKIEGHPNAPRIEYREGQAEQTGLPDSCADIVTASQAFHWMEPTATLAEVARILRPGGVFAAYDYDWPPVINGELDQLAQEVSRHVVRLIQERGETQALKIWPKDRHLDNMRASGHFSFTREVFLHQVEQGDAARYLAMEQSTAFSGPPHFPEQETGLDRLKRAVVHTLGSKPVPWYWSYRVRIGIKKDCFSSSLASQR